MNKLDPFIDRLDRLVNRLETLLPAPPAPIDWDANIAFRWHSSPGSAGRLVPIKATHPIRLADLEQIDRQKAALTRNTQQFLQGYPANNALLSGSRGTGKSSLVKALLNEYAHQGLRLIEVDPAHLLELPDIVASVAHRPERFILFCDDLSFGADDPSYKALKAALDGSISAPPENLLIYTTSNRRHLLPEFFNDNDEIHPDEAVSEKISLSERFGLWLSFHAFDQGAYLTICAQWLSALNQGQPIEESQWRADALRFALERGSRSGRVAWQFARDYIGQQALKQHASDASGDTL